MSQPKSGDELATVRLGPCADGSGASDACSQCTSDCVSAIGSPEPPPVPLFSAPCAEPSRGLVSDAERQLVFQNRLLKSSLIRALEKLQKQMEDSSRVRRLLSRLLKLRNAVQHTSPGAEMPSSARCSQTTEPADLYGRYEALVKQNYHLEQALYHSGGPLVTTGHHELDEYRTIANLQMTAMKEEWQDEREEKERALALNAELHQHIEQLQQELEQLQRQQRLPRQPLSEPFEALEPSGFTGSSSWGPEPSVRLQACRMLPPPGHTQTATGPWPTRRAARDVRLRRPGLARSVEEVLSAPYEAIRTGPPTPPAGHRPPAEADLRRPLPPPGRQPAPTADPRRPPPLLARDSGYSDLLAGPDEASDGSAAPLLSRV